MLQEIIAAVAAAKDEHAENPPPIEETPGVVRFPAFVDEHAQWQGGTITEMGDKYIVQLDDGRQFLASTAGAAATAFMTNADIWADPTDRAAA